MIVKRYKYFNEDSQEEVKQQETLSEGSKKKGLSTVAKVLGVSAAGTGIGGGLGYLIGKKKDVKLNEAKKLSRLRKFDELNDSKIKELGDKIRKRQRKTIPGYISILKHYRETAKKYPDARESYTLNKDVFLDILKDHSKSKKKLKKLVNTREERRRRLSEALDNIKPENQFRNKGAVIGSLAGAGLTAAGIYGYKKYKQRKNNKNEQNS